MLLADCRAEIYESKSIRNLPIGIQDDVVVDVEERIRRFYTLIPKESDEDVSDTVQSVSVSEW